METFADDPLPGIRLRYKSASESSAMVWPLMMFMNVFPLASLMFKFPPEPETVIIIRWRRWPKNVPDTNNPIAAVMVKYPSVSHAGKPPAAAAPSATPKFAKTKVAGSDD